MAVRSRRTRFAASFVVVVAGASGCSHERGGGGGSTGSSEPRSSWRVTQGSDGACWAVPRVDCSRAPAGVTCNPPAGLRVACPSPMPPDGITIVSYDGNHCQRSDGDPIACPSGDAPPPPPPPDAAEAADTGKPAGASFEPRSWQITLGDKVCYAQLTTVRCPAGASCNPPRPAQVTCPPYEPGAAVNEVAPDACRTTLRGGGGNCPPGLRCNPPPPREVDVPCPR